MKKTIKTISMVIMAVIMTMSLCACGGSDDSSGDVLKGTWVGMSDGQEVTWVFDGKGECTMNFTFKQTGTYTIDGTEMEVMLEMWSTPTIYSFTVSDTTLSMIPSAPYAPKYELTKK